LEERNRDLTESLEQQTATSEILRVIASSPTDLQAVLDQIARSAVQLCTAADAHIIRISGDVQNYVAHFGVPPPGGVDLSNASEIPLTARTPVGLAMLERRTVHIRDARERAEFPTVPDTQKVERTSLAVPLVNEDRAIGAILVRRPDLRPMTDAEIALMETFADQAVIAIENARLFDELTQLNHTLEGRVAEQVDELERVSRLRRYLAPQLADAIVSSGDESVLDNHRRQITAVFCDLRGFTPFAETAEPEEVMGVLAEYHAALGELVHQYQGTIEHFAGDGVMVFFNDPLPQPDHTERAVRLSIGLRDRITELALVWRRQGHQLGFGVGIAMGYATLGRIGFEGRFDYAAVGTVCNLAARLCAECAAGQILLSERVYGLVEDIVEVEQLGQLMLKGFHRPVDAVNVLGLRGPV